MKPEVMRPERFRHLAEAYGAEIARWPAAEQAAARDLAARSPDAQAALAQARILDAWLDLGLGTPEPVSDARADRVLAAIEERIAPPSVPWPLAAGRGGRAGTWTTAGPTAGFLVLMGVFGFLMGDLGIVSLWQHDTLASDLSALVASPSSSIAWNQ